MSSIRLSASRAKLRLGRKFQSHTCGIFLQLRHFSAESDENHPSIVNQALQLLQVPDDEWNKTEINHLLLSNSPNPHSPYLFFQISRCLPSHSQALKFLEFLREQSPAPDTRYLSFTLQAAIDLASREVDSPADLYELYKASKEWNVPLTVKSVIILLRCFERSGMVDESLVLFTEIESYLKKSPVRNIILRVLLKAGRVNDAFKVLDEMLQPNFRFGPDDSTGGIVFSWLMKNGKATEAISDEKVVELVLNLGGFGVFPDSVWLTRVISNMSRNWKLDLASKLLFELIKLGAKLTAAPCNALLTGLGKDRNLDAMNQLMATMKQKDIQPCVVTYGIIIKQLCNLRLVDGALEMFEMMNTDKKEDGSLVVDPDVIIYNTLIDGLCKVGRQEEGLGLIQRMKSQKGLSPTTVTYNCVIDCFCKVGKIERGLELFDEMKTEGVEPNEVTVNILVDGLCRSGRTNSAARFLTEMQENGFKCGAVAYTSLINAYCSVNNTGKAMECFQEIVNKGFSLDAMVYYNLINGLCMAGKVRDALVVFEKLKEDGFAPDVLCYNVLIGGCCNRKKIDEACNLLNEMKEVGLNPDVVTYNTLISYYGKQGDFKMARSLMKKMVNSGLAPTVFTYGAMIHASCLHGNLKEAMQIFEGMNAADSKVKPNTEIYNILIDSLCKNDDVELAVALMDDMISKKVRPNATTFNAIFKVLRERKLLEQGFQMMDRMKEQGCNPDYITLEVLTQWLSDAGETERLKRFVQG